VNEKGSSEISSLLRALRRRLVVRDFLATTARATLFFYGVLVLLTAATLWRGAAVPNPAGIPFMLTWPFVFGAVAGLLTALLRRPALRRVAEGMDALAGTRDRLLTACDFSGKADATAMETLALEEACGFLRGRSFAQYLPVRPPSELRWLVVPLVALGVLWWDAISLATARRERAVEQAAEVAGTIRQLEKLAAQIEPKSKDDERRQRIADRLKESVAQVRAEAAEGRDAQKAALRELSLLEELVKELRRPEAATEEELKELAAALAKHEATKDAAHELEQGRLAEAARKLEEAAKDKPGAEQVAQSVRQALEHLARQKEQMSKQLEELREQAQEGGGERQQLLQQLAQALDKLAKQGAQAGGKQPQKGDGKQQQAAGKPMSDDDLKKLLGALAEMKNAQQEGEGGEGDAPPEGEPKPGDGQISMLSFGRGGKDGEPDIDSQIPSGKPGTEQDKGTSESPFGKQGAAGDAGVREQLGGKLGAGESLSVLIPSAAGGDAKATRRFKELTDAAATTAQDAVLQENIPLGSRFLIKRYFEAIRPKQ
jgi:hypothetical protein